MLRGTAPFFWSEEGVTMPPQRNPYMDFCRRERNTVAWKRDWKHRPVAQQGSELGRRYQRSKTSTYRGANASSDFSNLHSVNKDANYTIEFTPTAIILRNTTNQYEVTVTQKEIVLKNNKDQVRSEISIGDYSVILRDVNMTPAQQEFYATKYNSIRGRSPKFGVHVSPAALLHASITSS